MVSYGIDPLQNLKVGHTLTFSLSVPSQSKNITEPSPWTERGSHPESPKGAGQMNQDMKEEYMIFYENLEHYGIKIANFINFCETVDT